VAEIRTGAGVFWPAAASAVGLVTSRRARADDTQAELLGSARPEEVLDALTTVTTALLDVLLPGELGDRALRVIGLAALEMTTEQAGP